MEAKYWYKVLKHFDNKRYFQNGLTIPFLIGSITILSEGKTLITIEEFLSQIENEGISSPVTILKCKYLGEYVIGLLDSETNRMIRHYKTKNRRLYKEFGGLIIVDDSFKEIDNFKEITEILKNSYQKIIETNNFSRELGKWIPYTEIDLERLREIQF